MITFTREELIADKVNVDIIKGVSDDNNEAGELLEKELDSHGFNGLVLYQRTSENGGVHLVGLASQM